MDAEVPLESTSGFPQPKKLKRLPGACDACRLKKSDSAEREGGICSRCQASDIECTHDTPRQAKRPDSKVLTIQDLQQKVDKMQRLLQIAYPDDNLDSLLDLPLDELELAASSRSSPGVDLYSRILPSLVPHAGGQRTIKDEPDDDESVLLKRLQTFTVSGGSDVFFGDSSAYMFIRDASAKQKALSMGHTEGIDCTPIKRPEFWATQPWEKGYGPQPDSTQYIFPDEDLLRSLVFVYFEKFNTLFPLLHRPSFLKSLVSGDHLRDSSFGMVVLFVCALGSRYSSDPRVILPGDPHGLSSGWQFFSQVDMNKFNTFSHSTLAHLQAFTLATMYLVGTSIPHYTYHVLGLAIRNLVEKGGHRRPSYPKTPTPKGELTKRVFWCLYMLDRVLSSFLGRPCTIQDEDFDVDYPVECDDDYWETPNPEDAFKQPPGKPSVITSFVLILKLWEIMGLALRTLYATKKSKTLQGMTQPDSVQRVVAEFDSALNQWKDSIPQFLTWDPERQPATFFHQSVSIYAAYHYLQIQVHRPFLTKESELSMASFAICTNAARSCIRILEVSLTRGMRVLPHTIMATFCAGTVIAMNSWGIRYAGLPGDPDRESAIFQRCVNVLHECEKRWHIAGRACDMLHEVAALRDYRRSAVPKRSREEDAPVQYPGVYDQSVSATQPPPSAPPQPSPGNFVPMANIPAPDWDLTSFFAPKGYEQPQQIGYAGDTTSVSASAQQQIDANTGYLTMPFSYSPGQGQDQPDGMAELFSAWADVPMVFSLDDWNAFITNISNSAQ